MSTEALSTRIRFHKKQYRFQLKRNNCIVSTQCFVSFSYCSHWKPFSKVIVSSGFHVDAR